MPCVAPAWPWAPEEWQLQKQQRGAGEGRTIIPDGLRLPDTRHGGRARWPDLAGTQTGGRRGAWTAGPRGSRRPPTAFWELPLFLDRLSKSENRYNLIL